MASWQQKLIDTAKAEGKPNPLPIYGADGLGGKETQAALEAYQTSHGLTVTGQFDDPTKAALDPPKPKDIFMPLILPTIVHWIIALLPGIPDDVNIVEAELKELASTDDGKTKLRAALVFGKTLIAKIEAVIGS